MNMIGHTTHAKASTSCVASDRCEIGVQGAADRSVEERSAVFRTENDVNDDEREGLRHGRKYRVLANSDGSGLQPSRS